ncbi:hypothetical protein AOQ84DRAFT_37821 [Glonium stellatum]|uniref:Uncharacterized protein n=1 Tax=Glonium stellatum TaxID=574774 RepID=A0A8E2F1U1_9PEZI|nr:hypothetical protein AOQ84DRAFT_37821 [Glonium stellatum]
MHTLAIRALGSTLMGRAGLSQWTRTGFLVLTKQVFAGPDAWIVSTRLQAPAKYFFASNGIIFLLNSSLSKGYVEIQLTKLFADIRCRSTPEPCYTPCASSNTERSTNRAIHLTVLLSKIKTPPCS